MRAIIYILGLFIFGSCVPDVFLSFSTTKANGLRMKNPERLKFPGEQFHLANTSQIDTGAIFIFSNYELQGAQPFEISNAIYCRFFPEGQVLFVEYDTILTAEIVNNPESGRQGYYKIVNDKIMIREFKILNGGQIIPRWGRFKNGDILFYSNTPRAYSNSWERIEKDDLKERWRKVKIEGMTQMKLDW